LKKDTQKGSGHWTGCHAFNDIVCDNEENTHPANRRNIGLKQGGTYYYYFVINNTSNFYDVNTPYTSLCPMLPGQAVNILEVPIERPMSSGSSLLCDVERKRLESVKRAEALVAQAKQKMMSPLLRRKRTGSAGTTMAKERKEKMRSEWLMKGIERLQGTASRIVSSREGQKKESSAIEHGCRMTNTKEDKILRKAISAPDVLPTGAILPTVALIDEVDQARSFRESFGTMSLNSESTLSAEADQLQTPQLYHSATSSVEATPKTLLETPHIGGHTPGRGLPHIAINHEWPLASPDMLPNYAQAAYQSQPQKMQAQTQSWSTNPAAYSRHTLAAPIEPSMHYIEIASPAPSNNIVQHDNSTTTTLHPFFKQGNRTSLNGFTSNNPAVLSRADTERDDDDRNDNLSLGLGLTRQKMDVLPVQVHGNGVDGLGLGLGIDLNAVNARLSGETDESEANNREFAYLGSVIY